MIDYIMRIGSILVFLTLALFGMQLILFELSYKRSKEIGHIDRKWLLNYTEGFKVSNLKNIFLICLLAFFLTGNFNFTVESMVFLLLFLCIAMISNILVQYFSYLYARFRLKTEIEETLLIKKELEKDSEDNQESIYEISQANYNELEITEKYINENQHVAIISNDKGEFMKKFTRLGAVNFLVEPYQDMEEVKANINDESIRVTKYADQFAMPFKDDRIDLLMVQNVNYDKAEVKRSLKDNGIFIVNQAGTMHLKELIQYPRGLGVWDLNVCKASLIDEGFEILESYENHGYIEFRDFHSIRQYVKPMIQNYNDREILFDFYSSALKSIKENGYYRLSTYYFCIVSRIHK